MDTKEQSKILLIGTERNCRSIGYVLEFEDYVMLEKLTPKSFAQYQDYQIYVCELKHKSKKLVHPKLLKANIKLQYLDDICRKIDEDYANLHRQTKSKKQTESAQVAIKTTEPQITQSTADTTKGKKHASLFKRIIRGMKHPFRSASHVMLHLRWLISCALKRKIIKKKIKNFTYNKYDHNHIKYLCSLTPSELLLHVMSAPINPQMKCARLEKKAEIFVWYNGDAYGCCRCLVPFGNFMKDEPDDILNGIYSRIVKLSSLNRSYCLCPVDRCSCECNKVDTTPFRIKNLDLPDLTRKLTLGFDMSCNLACKSCRKQHYVMDEEHHQIASTVVSKLLKSDWLERADNLLLAGLGEVFHSPYYRQLLTTDLKRKQITVYSNGTLFNEKNWQLVANQYESISVRISIDAATKETYQYLRGANFDALMKNLKMLGELRHQKKIKTLDFCFVVQRANFREMPAFIKMAHELNVDRIEFQRMHNWGHFTEQEYLEQCLIVDNKYLDYDLWCVFQDPIFQRPMSEKPFADLREFYRFFEPSDKLYRKRYKQELQNAR